MSASCGWLFGVWRAWRCEDSFSDNMRREVEDTVWLKLVLVLGMPALLLQARALRRGLEIANRRALTLTARRALHFPILAVHIGKR